MGQRARLRPEAKGEFLVAVKGGECRDACSKLDFRVLAPLFVQERVARNETDKECFDWIVDLVGAPLVSALRSDATSEVVEQCGELATNLKHAVSETFGGTERFADVSAMLDALSVGFEVLLADGGHIVPRPSQVRDSL